MAQEQPIELPALLTETTIALDELVRDWEEAIRRAGALLLQQGAVQQRYVEAMVGAVKELGPYMVIAPGIALAHARPEDGVLRVCMSMVRLSQPVEFGSAANDPVDLVFGLGGVDHEQHLRALKQLALLLQREKAVACLRQARSVSEALAIIRGSATSAGDATDG